MLNKIISLCILTLLVLTACEQEAAKVEITTDIKGQPISQLIFINPIEDISDTLDMTASEPHLLTLGAKTNLVTMLSGRTRTPIYVEPGAKIKISRAEGKREFTITGDFAAEQKLLKDYEIAFGRSMGNFGPNKIMREDLASFNRLLEQKYEGVTMLHNQSKDSGNVSSDLLSWISKRIEAGKVQDKINYPLYYNYFMKKEAEIGDVYYAFAETFDYDNKEQYYFEEVRRTAEAAMVYDINFQEMSSTAEYYIAKLDAVNKYVRDPEVREYLKHNILMEKLTIAGGVDDVEDQVSEFLSTSRSELRKTAISNEVAKWDNIRKGLAAPNFNAFTRDGQEVKLSDLKGKNVYIDVWATWCGPCIAEIPSLKKMEEKYHEENLEFVSVSIDNPKDTQKWMDFVEAKQLGGTQIMAKEAWQSAIAANYNISSIPRFIMVDKDGKIVSADAPRPSAEKQFDGMLAGVLK